MAAVVKTHSVLPPPHSALMSTGFPSHSNSAEAQLSVQLAGNDRRSTDSAGHLLPQPIRPLEAGSPTSAGPSPIAPSSNGTEIDDTATEEEFVQTLETVEEATSSPASKRSSVRIVTRDEDGNTLRNDSPEANPASVIHAPKGYLSFSTASPPGFGRVTPVPAPAAHLLRRRSSSASASEKQGGSEDGPLSPPAIDTAVRPVHDPFATPRATTRTDIDIEERRKEKGRKPSLENIPEDSAVEETDEDRPLSAFFESEADRLRRSNEEVAALKDALAECWTLCNTLAGLSSLHRERAFRQARKEDKREQAWKCCWKLCQKLYETRDEDSSSVQAGLTLDLCREFCQALFDVRQRRDEVADSVLRVSFELNNHLYNTHDRSLPEAFLERTLDFYITLCHRLMKQRNAMVEDADSLLRACWGLAEMLFSLRQNRREGKPPNDELLGSAVQACWELCDLFREGWKQVRPDRGTPRPSSIGFSQTSSSRQLVDRPRSVATINLGDSSDDDNDEGRMNPETPTTIFEDMNQFSPDDEEGSVPNILVLGPENPEYALPRWSSSASDVSSQYDSAISHRSKSTNKIDSGPLSSSTSSTLMSPDGDGSGDAARLSCLKLLIVRAAQLTGFDKMKNHTGLQAFVRSAPSDSFGASVWEAGLLNEYKKLVAGDPAFRTSGPPTRASAADVARAVRWMVRSGQYVWLEDLYKWVLGFRIDEARDRANVWVQT